MSNKLIFRVIGALSAGVIIVSLFVPFSALQSEGLWDVYDTQQMMYIPIIIISLAAISIISFSTNIKSEFAYISFGGCLFYIITKAIEMNSEGNLGNVSLGFYLLALGTAFMGLMAFLCNLSKKTQKENNIVSDEKSTNELTISNTTDLFNPQTPLQPNDISDNTPALNSELTLVNSSSNMDIFNTNQQVDNISLNQNSPVEAESLNISQLDNLPSNSNLGVDSNMQQPQLNLVDNYVNQNVQNSINDMSLRNPQTAIPEGNNLNINELNNTNLGSAPIPEMSNQVQNVVNNNSETFEQPIAQNNLNQIDSSLIGNQNGVNNEISNSTQVLNNTENNIEAIQHMDLNNQVPVVSNIPQPTVNNEAINVNNNSQQLDTEGSIPEIVPQQEQNIVQQPIDNTNLNNNSNDINNVPNLDIFGI